MKLIRPSLEFKANGSISSRLISSPVIRNKQNANFSVTRKIMDHLTSTEIIVNDLKLRHTGNIICHFIYHACSF